MEGIHGCLVCWDDWRRFQAVQRFGRDNGLVDVQFLPYGAIAVFTKDVNSDIFMNMLRIF